MDKPNDSDKQIGEKLIAEGKVGTIILAGGVGSRLGFDGPKGTFVLPHIKKSLFQIFFEKIKKDFPFAIMTSEQNHKQTVNFLKKHNYFGLAPDIYIQNSLPYLDEHKKPLNIKGPAGNGEALSLLYKSGIWERWKQKGVEQVLTVLIDNPLADPCDPYLAGYHHRKQNEVTLKCVSKIDPEEKVGIVVNENNKIKVVEYSQMTDIQKHTKDSIASISLFSFSMDFIKKTANADLPLHLVKKQTKFGPALKQERYIFDILPFASKVSILLYPREQTFAPLKTLSDVPVVERAFVNRPLV